MSFFNNENKRRKFNKIVDQNPSFLHRLNYRFAKPYVKNKIVLDIGCWSGQIEKLAVEDAKEITGIDPGGDAIDFAKKNNPKAHFEVGTIGSIPFEDNSFDTVLLLEVLEHIPNGTETSGLDEINRVLKKGGFLILTTPNNNFISILLDPAFFLLGHRHYSENKLRDFLGRCGFEVVDFSIRGGIIQGSFNNISLLAKHLLNKKIKETSWIKKRIEKEYMPGGFMGNCLVARKIG